MAFWYWPADCHKYPVHSTNSGLTTLSVGLNFINILRTNFSFERPFGSFFDIHVTREKLPKQCSYENVYEIDYTLKIMLVLELAESGFNLHIFFPFREPGALAIHSSSWHPGWGRCHPHASGLRHPPRPQVWPLNGR